MVIYACSISKLSSFRNNNIVDMVYIVQGEGEMTKLITEEQVVKIKKQWLKRVQYEKQQTYYRGTSSRISRVLR